MDNISELPEFLQALKEIGIIAHDQSDTIYKYCSADIAKIILNEKKIRFTTPIEFNDPFEMFIGLIDFSNPKEHIHSLAEKYLKAYPTNNYNEIVTDLNSLSDVTLIDTFRKIYNEDKKKRLVTCFSTKHDDTLMWSHYGDKHKGVCIGFKIPTMDINIKLFTLKVNYLDKVKPMKMHGVTDADKSVAIFHWLLSKSSIWKYEEEVRSIIMSDFSSNIDENGNLDVGIKNENICEIYYGCGIKQNHFDEVEKIILDNNYSIEKKGKMRIDYNTFQLRTSYS